MAFKACPLPGPELATKGVIDIPARMLTLVFRVVLRWNTREGFWMASVYDPTGRPIVRDIACRCDEDILENVIRRYCPKGAIVVRDRSGADRDPARDGWSRGSVIMYEFEVLEAAA